MAYEEKTDWLPDDPINEDDVNRWEKGIKDAHTDLAAHKNDMNNPHNTTKAQIGLGSVDDVQQASKIEFNNHDNDSTRHITSTERTNWNAKETTAGAQKKADAAEKNAKAYTDQHRNDTNNPHSVTKDQIGLGKVTNDKQATKSEFDAHINDQIRHISDSERTKWNGAQLFKITDDNGQGKIYVKETDDFHEIIPKYPGLVHFTSNVAAINGPGTAVRGIWTCNSTGTFGQVIAFDNANKTYRKTVSNGVWSGWEVLETTSGAQAKVDAHTKNTSIHVTQTDKDKWNGSQLTKITNDYGGIAFSVNAGEDMLQAIVNRGRGMGTFYAIGTAVNSPSEASTRGFYQMTSQDADGKGMYGWVYAMDYKNNVFTNYYDGNKVGWQGWNKLDTENAAQMRIEKAVSDAKDYTDSNFSNEKLMVLPIASGIEDARTPGTEYPFGITLMKIYDNNQTGYPLGYGLIKNEKWNNARFTQYFYGNADSRNGKNYLTGTWIRHWWLESGWTPWEKISGFAHANIGTTGRQTLKKAEQNKILYNRVIIDSHGAFDISNNRFIAPNDGMYLIGGGAYVETIATYTNLELQVFRNGSFYKSVQQFRNSDGQNTDSRDLTISCGGVTVPLKKGDYVELYIYCGYSGDVTRYIGDKNGQYNYFDIAEIGGKVY
ncbi:terminase [Bacillus atrophaeus]|uniref:terminase n=1 Tax=Bacillus atrophaeus TaxID=1452 RepID=UPI002E1C1ED0|nr:terminase [Bacillus atrophaeus]